MLPVWRLTRNEYARNLYDRLHRVGITATRMYEYETDLVSNDPIVESPVSADSVSFETLSAADVPQRGFEIDFSIPTDFLQGEWAIVARIDGEPVGRTLVSGDTTPYVHPLDRSMSFPGAYVRRVFVTPEWRGAGLGTQMVKKALVVARDEFRCERASALIAVDNKPSQWLFDAVGFAPVRVHEFVRIGGFTWERTSPVAE